MRVWRILGGLNTAAKTLGAWCYRGGPALAKKNAVTVHAGTGLRLI